VLAALLSGKVDDGAVIVVVLLTRIMQTLVDLSLGAVGLALTRRRTGSPTGVDE
jgi:hypothetical protein